MVLSGCVGGSGADPAVSTPPTTSGVQGPDLAAFTELRREMVLEPGLSLLFTADGLAAGPVETGFTISDESPYGAVGTVQSNAADGEAELAIAAPAGDVASFDFPGVCKGDQPCLRPIIEVPQSDGTSPGTSDFRVVARLRMDPEDATAGSNVVQKGFATGGGGQWKMQVDGLEGLPSCTVVEPGSNRINLAKAEVPISDGAWHTVECVRTGDVLTVVVDGVVADSESLPADLNLVINAPVRIGGKNANPGNDPFHGELALVGLNVAPSIPAP